MKQLIPILVFFFFGSINIVAQSKASIKGSIIDENGEAISYATVSLLNDSNQLVLGAITDEKGKFELDQINYGSYDLNIQFLGFQSITKKIGANATNKKINLGQIPMSLDNSNLEQVVVTAEKSQYNLRLDKKVFHVGKDALSQGGSAIEVLNQVPLVSVDPSGSVQLRGSNEVLILINGRRSGLTMNNALEQIPGDNIERIEVITNPSSSFDASGTAGIINIILKKNKQEGLSGQLRASVGTPANHTIMPSINYKGAKLNLFSNYRWRYSDYNGTYKRRQQNFTSNGTDYLDQKEDEHRHDDGQSGYIGADYYINDKNTFTLAYFRAETKDTDETALDYTFTDSDQNHSMIQRQGNSVEERDYNQLESNYTRTFDKKGQRLSVDFQYDFWNSDKNWELLSTGNIVESSVAGRLRTKTSLGSKDYALKADFVKPITEKAKVETGAKYENREVYNDYLAETYQAEKWSTYNNIDNDIDYTERIGAAYVQYQSSIDKIEYSLGLRVEQTDIEIADVEKEFDENKDYLNLFPSAHVGYKFSENLSMQLGYSRRINRPSLWSLYPFFEIKDFNFQYTGNPNLNPSFTDGVEMSFLAIFEKLTINPTIYYKHTADPVEHYLEQFTDGTFLAKPVNIEQQNDIGAELSIRYKPNKVFTLSGEGSVYSFDKKGSYNNQSLNVNSSTFRLRFSSDIKILKEIGFQTTLDYHGSERSAQTKTLDYNVLSFGLSKDFINDRLNVSIRAFNVLDTRKEQTIAESANYYVKSESQRYGPRYGVSAVYKINQGSRQRMRQQRRSNR